MAQRPLGTKSGSSSASKRGWKGSRGKATKTKKGRRFVAPRKPKAKEEHKERMQVTRLVDAKNHEEAKRKASKDGTRFDLLRDASEEGIGKEREEG